MYPVSEEYLNKMTARVVDLSSGAWYAEINTTDGNNYLAWSGICAEGGNSLRREVCTGDLIEIGTTCSAELNLKIKLGFADGKHTLNGNPIDSYSLYGAEVILVCSVHVGEGLPEQFRCGAFRVTEANIKDSTASITAYDYMLLLEKRTLVYAAKSGTPYEYLTALSAKTGVALGNTQAEIEAMPNGNQVFHRSLDLEMTWRELLGHLAAILCSNAVIGRDGKLYLLRYSNTAVRTIPPSWRYSSEIADFKTFYSSLYVGASEGVDAVNIGTESGLEYDLTGNIFLMKDTPEGVRSAAIENILNGLKLFSYTPYEVSCPLDLSLDVMDVLRVSDKQGYDEILGPITSIDIDLGGGMEIKSTGSNPRFKQVKSRLGSAVASAESSSHSGGGSGEAPKYSHYISGGTINIADGGEEVVIRLRHTAKANYHVDFHGEITYELETTEAASGSDAVCNDARLLVKYVRDGETVSYYPVETQQDGTHILNLMYFWVETVDRENGYLNVYLSVTNGAVKIHQLNSRGYLCWQYCEVTKELASIEITHEPNKTVFEEDEALDYSGIEITAYYTDGSSQIVTSSCEFSPRDGSTPHTFGDIDVNVAYTEDSVTKETQFTVKIKHTISLKYLIYTIDEDSKVITVTGLNIPEIVADNLETLEIPDSYEGYSIYIT